jgi:hypothetical protein
MFSFFNSTNCPEFTFASGQIQDFASEGIRITNQTLLADQNLLIHSTLRPVIWDSSPCPIERLFQKLPRSTQFWGSTRSWSSRRSWVDGVTVRHLMNPMQCLTNTKAASKAQFVLSLRKPVPDKDEYHDNDYFFQIPRSSLTVFTSHPNHTKSDTRPERTMISSPSSMIMSSLIYFDSLFDWSMHICGT